MGGTRKSTRSTVIINQSQADSKSKSALCGMLSVNNAVQERDVLTQAIMEPVLDQLKITHPKQDHGCKKNGQYSMLSLSHALHTKGWNLVYLNDKLPYSDMSKKKWFPRLAAAVRLEDDMEEWEAGEELENPTMITVTKRLVIIGTPPGQEEGVLHAITMAKGKLIDPDFGTVREATDYQLRQWMEHICGVYAIMNGGELAQFMEDQDRLWSIKKAKMAAKGKVAKKKRKC